MTVLAYHRIAEPGPQSAATFQPNISATPEAFAAQMDLLCKKFNVVSLYDLLDWLAGKRPLPPYSVLITFDDGYRDNLLSALPILRQRGLPATIFLATGHIERAKPFFWDHVAYGFNVTRTTAGDLPLLGQRQWQNAEDKADIQNEWLAAAKILPEKEKLDAVGALLACLDAPAADETFKDMHLSWDEVRLMAEAGIEFGAHTVNHPILSRLPMPQAEAEVRLSKEHIEKEIGRPVRAFAYPNGLADDFNGGHKTMLARLGFDAAFSLIKGPSSFAEVFDDRYAIRRVFVGHGDSLARFEAKCVGLQRLKDM